MQGKLFYASFFSVPSVLPKCNTEMMNLYLKGLSERFSDDLLLVCCDGASWHKSKGMEVPENIVLFFIPPYTPEMNPIEQIWKELRSRGFSDMQMTAPVPRSFPGIESNMLKASVIESRGLWECEARNNPLVSFCTIIIYLPQKMSRRGRRRFPPRFIGLKNGALCVTVNHNNVRTEVRIWALRSSLPDPKDLARR